MPPLASMWRMNGGGHQRDQLVRSCIALLTPFPQAHSLLTPASASCNWIFFTPQSWLELLGHVTWFPAPRRFSKMPGEPVGNKASSLFPEHPSSCLSFSCEARWTPSAPFPGLPGLEDTPFLCAWHPLPSHSQSSWTRFPLPKSLSPFSSKVLLA